VLKCRTMPSCVLTQRLFVLVCVPVCAPQVSLAGLWLMPAILSTMFKFWRFLFIWCCYSLITGYLMSLCMHKKMHHSTPRKVGKWGAVQGWSKGGSYLACHVLGASGILAYTTARHARYRGVCVWGGGGCRACACTKRCTTARHAR
jgi:hypothetical protein